MLYGVTPGYIIKTSAIKLIGGGPSFPIPSTRMVLAGGSIPPSLGGSG